MFWRPRVVAGRPPTRSSHQLVVLRNGQPCKQRTYHVVSRMGDNHDLGVFNNNVSAVERAMVERYFLCKVGEGYQPALRTNRGAWDTEVLREFRRECVSYVSARATKVSEREVVNMYRGAKRRIYENALRSLYRTPINRKDASLRPFTKFEKQSLSKAPRIINPRSPRYNLKLGQYLKLAEKLYYKAINRIWGEHTEHTVIKGLNPFESARVMKSKWDRFKDPIALGLDATKFDMHVSIWALAFEHSIYDGTFNSATLRELLSWQLLNSGTAYCPDGQVKFKMPGTRSSGDLNTSLGNCLLMCALIHEMCRKLGVDAELANNGDDCVLMFERTELQKVLECVPGFFAEKGFRMTVEAPVDIFEQLEFCQSRPVLLAGGWCMVRNVRTCLKKDPMCLVPIQNTKVWRKWLAAVGQCGLATVPGCPVLQSFYGAFERSGSRTTKRFNEHVFRNTSMVERATKGKPTTILDTARASFYRAFGITPDYQIALEHYFDRVAIGDLNEELRVGVVENMPPVFLRHL